MRFQKHERHVATGITARKAAAMLLKQKREQAKYPLFPDQIAEQQAPINLDDEERIRQARFEKCQQDMRNLEAKFWRNARRKYYLLTSTQRQAIREEWMAWRGPATAPMLSYVIDKHTGEYERRANASKARELEIRQSIVADFQRQSSISF